MKNKRKAQLLFILITAISFIYPIEAKILELKGVSKSEIVNIRKKPNSDSKIIGFLEKNDEFNIISANDNRSWLKIKTPSSNIGWVKSNSINKEIIGKIDYGITNLIGTEKEKGVLIKPIKALTDKSFIYVIDVDSKISLVKFDKNYNFISRNEIDYKWIKNYQNYKNIIFTIDEEFNFYTNSEKINTITKYNKDFEIIDDLKIKGIFSQINYKENKLYLLDENNKIIRIVDLFGKKIKNIFLSETEKPIKFKINNSKIYILDYSTEKELDKVYYVDSYGFSLKDSYDNSSDTITNISKGSIIKGKSENKIYISKEFNNENETDFIEKKWQQFNISDSEENISEGYGEISALKEIYINGKVDVYDLNGKYQNSISLNDNWFLKSPDRNRNYGKLKVVKEIRDISFNSNNLVLGVITKSHEKKRVGQSLNYYILDTKEKSYKISQTIPTIEKENINFIINDGRILSLNQNKYFDIISPNGLLKSKLGKGISGGLYLPNKFTVRKKNYYIFDQINSSLQKLNLNGEIIKSIYNKQSTDLFIWSDVYFSENNIILLKKIYSEEIKLGIELYDYKLNKISDKWLLTLDENNLKSFIHLDKSDNIFIFAKGNHFDKPVILSIFDKTFNLINSWEEKGKMLNILPQEIRKQIRAGSIKFIDFCEESSFYILAQRTDNKYKIIKISLNKYGQGKIERSIDTNFTDQKTINDIVGSINFLEIKEGKKGFVYLLYQQKNESKIAIFNPLGEYIKNLELNKYNFINGFELDENDNIWVSDKSTLKKLSN